MRNTRHDYKNEEKEKNVSSQPYNLRTNDNV